MSHCSQQIAVKTVQPRSCSLQQPALCGLHACILWVAARLLQQEQVMPIAKPRHWIGFYGDLDGFFLSFGLEDARSLALLVLHFLLHCLHL